MRNQKTRGAYYTPLYLANFILKHSYPHLKNTNKINILEPSLGDGIFIDSISSSNDYRLKKISFTGIEKYISELRKAEMKSKECIGSFNFIHGDFLNIQKRLSQNFNFIIGNPPYIKINRLNKTQRLKSNDINSLAGLNTKSVKNIWSIFLIRCVQLLSAEGVLAFVLPSDLLQVKFSNEIRNFLINQFERIEIFTFDDLLFPQIGQDTILLFCFRHFEEKGVFYSNIKDIRSLENDSYSLRKNKSLTSSGTKWTHHFLSDEDISFLLKLKSRLNVINDYCESKPGVVTAANNYFIINSELVLKYNLERFSQNILQRGSYINGKVIFNREDLSFLEKKNIPTKLLCFSDDDFSNMNKKNKTYLDIGKELGIHNRYKCSLRKNWFVVPNVGEPEAGFFFKRCHKYPRILLNKANVLVTDSAYKIIMKDNRSIRHLIYSFYNSLTLAFAELEGRYYGDGVLELTPSEFKKLPLPWVSVSNKEFNDFKKNFEKKLVIEDVVDNYDDKILGATLKISSFEIERIRSIRKKLLNKRLRVK